MGGTKSPEAKDVRWTLVDKQLLNTLLAKHPGLALTARRVGPVLIECYNTRTGLCCPSVSHIAAEITASPRAVQVALRQLERKGVLDTERNAGPNGTNLYHPNFEIARRYGEAKKVSSHAAQLVAASFFTSGRTAFARTPEHLDLQGANGASHETFPTPQGNIPKGAERGEHEDADEERSDQTKAQGRSRESIEARIVQQLGVDGARLSKLKHADAELLPSLVEAVLTGKDPIDRAVNTLRFALEGRGL
ncbi:helix-turn-helix domain-containing protein [Limibaculum sp. M0105]|uniref:Helix-turn-helix domain-containing protein n=1 Tax=Thermohalobaculum xanthum TaxID=2753746 RepID=A0A8J7SD51_9RHOB|nr:helix-turn-helix domain-containing protein [Thermohalobaculum xanthum]MBK0399013.1 helix-turn-helix domain-containing protein [Thermohalobaculum xanthum]